MHPCLTPFSTLNQSESPCLVRTLAFWLLYILLSNMIMCVGIPILFISAHSLSCTTMSKALEKSIKHRYMSLFLSLFFSIAIFKFIIWFVVPLPGREPACSSDISRSRVTCSLLVITFKRTLLLWLISAMVLLLQHCNVSPYFGMGMKTEFSQSCGHCFSFQIFVQSLW